MSELTNRLRSFAKAGGATAPVVRDAADEIARLEALIQKMIDAWDNNDRAKYQGIIEEMEGAIVREREAI